MKRMPEGKLAPVRRVESQDHSVVQRGKRHFVEDFEQKPA